MGKPRSGGRGRRRLCRPRPSPRNGRQQGQGRLLSASRALLRLPLTANRLAVLPRALAAPLRLPHRSCPTRFSTGSNDHHAPPLDPPARAAPARASPRQSELLHAGLWPRSPPRGVVAALLLAILVTTSLSLAGPGHDHGPAPAGATAPASPRVTATSDAFELVGIVEGEVLVVYLDRFATNEPITGAAITLSLNGTDAESRAAAEWHLRSGLADPESARPRRGRRRDRGGGRLRPVGRLLTIPRRPPPARQRGARGASSASGTSCPACARPFSSPAVPCSSACSSASA